MLYIAKTVCYTMCKLNITVERAMIGFIFDIFITVFCVILLFNFFVACIGGILMIIGMIGIVDQNDNMYFIPLVIGLLLVSSR